ncbi:MAG: cupin domain-containing protein [Candidatus Nitrosotenuis sp.]
MKLEFNVKEYIDNIRNSTGYFHTFLNRENIAAGVLVLQPHEEDSQTPHDADEVYFVVRGDGYLKINNKDYEVSEGKAFYVQKNVPHKFFGNKKEIIALYFFSGPDS